MRRIDICTYGYLHCQEEYNGQCRILKYLQARHLCQDQKKYTQTFPVDGRLSLLLPFLTISFVALWRDCNLARTQSTWALSLQVDVSILGRGCLWKWQRDKIWFVRADRCIRFEMLLWINEFRRHGNWEWMEVWVYEFWVHRLGCLSQWWCTIEQRFFRLSTSPLSFGERAVG